MAGRQGALDLLQVVALMLPAVAIYLNILSERHELSEMDEGLAANYHTIRLTFIYLLFAGSALLVALAFERWEFLLTSAALAFIFLALFTFVLPVAFSKVGIDDDRCIIWPYRNAIHRIAALIKYGLQKIRDSR